MAPASRLALNPLATLFRHNGGLYLFDPASRTCASMNEAMLAFLTQPDGAGFPTGLSGDDRAALMDVARHLRERGVLVEVKDGGNGTSREPQDAPSMTRLVIFLTSKCNLQCAYCYARGGDSGKTIRKDVWQIAMDHFFSTLAWGEAWRFARRHGVNLTIHGGGEPTVEFATLKEIVAEFRERARGAGLRTTVTLGTNGTYAEAVHQWIVENDIQVTFSLDGPRDIHNLQRPFRSGAPSYDLVVRNLAALVKAGRYVSIRATITREALATMEETVELARQLGLAAVRFEPVTLTGRGSSGTVSRPDVEQFTEKFLKCFLLGLRYDINVGYSGIHCFERCRQRFCSACGHNFGVTPDGDISTCYEVLDATDPAASMFFIGRVDVAERRVVLDEQRIEALKRRVASNMKACEGCLLRYQCAGDCPIKSFRYSTRDLYHPDPYRCEIANRINKTLIAWVADGVIEPRHAEQTTVFSVNQAPQ